MSLVRGKLHAVDLHADDSDDDGGVAGWSDDDIAWSD